MKTIMVDTMHAFVVKGEGIYEPMQALLETYPNRKILFTNADDEEMDRFGLHEMPYEVFTLKHAPEKTDPEYFKKVLQHYNLTPKDVVYFEHNTDAVKSAQSVGITTLHYDKEGKDLAELKRFLDKNL